MKRFLSVATATIVLLAFGTAAQASSNAKVPHLAGSSSDLNNAKFQPGNYSLKVHVMGQEVSALMVEAQDSVRLSKNIQVFDQFNKPIAATVSMNGQMATITFAQPVKPDTSLRVELRNVQNPNALPTAFFSVSSQVVGLGSEIALGTTQVTTRYGRI
ncbi:hypothetical protein NIES2135_62360 (plasmid) [Leptolyngbya boryana NIES-2135]|uniref:DUF2808 domain-containing protein n=1 Tax=Leptolyngbya boryana NIES-2135 TaxID=1973484 RepID=A0A1Z4JRK6_LEPBY|nr:MULTISPECIES: DUF2808 domain-containing protein [Leptolyngbya]BAY59359.1 hypothetical protein NIES2135_62360 [Leptolyngbya boryana NIES-2135]MBD2372947.1 DUF2808 domain-containing protein [Leptolyngbya sp. FACHB-238]MBD2397300.1 DUF2808 domain-containing protein [Leptolyngbya sp. FACHB-239]MBD2403895.1 DUF2808 domain-containing protein [Leptolyngbya sp. FACHB-402]ULP33191.1 DUF2808 domain-containing protein [Leptolyngbya boryana IU 594]